MSGFSTSWLDLREPADRAARAPETLAACAERFRDAAELSICDLGAGAGASVAAFAGILPARRRWRLVDADADLLAEAERRHAGGAVPVETRRADLAATPDPWPRDCGLVTATALFDLASVDWIDRFAEALARDRLPLLATLTYDGRQTFSPSHADDAALLDAFNRHQQIDKGLGGAAAGPHAAPTLIAALERRGYRIVSADSPWRLSGADRDLIAELLRGWARAVNGAEFAPEDVVTRWLAARLRDTQAMTVGHTDVFATPPDR